MPQAHGSKPRSNSAVGQIVFGCKSDSVQSFANVSILGTEAVTYECSRKFRTGTASHSDIKRWDCSLCLLFNHSHPLSGVHVLGRLRMALVLYYVEASGDDLRTAVNLRFAAARLVCSLYFCSTPLLDWPLAYP
jgi:hypothetical protein